MAFAFFLLPALADASGTGGVDCMTSTVQKIVQLPTADPATAAFLLIIVLGFIAWWIMCDGRAGEVLGCTAVGAVINIGAAQISEYFAVQSAVV